MQYLKVHKSAGYRPTYTTLTDKVWSCWFFFFFLWNFKSNLTSLRFLMIMFTLKYSKNNDFYFFLTPENAVFPDFLCFLLCTQFPWFFRIFRIVENLPLWCKPDKVAVLANVCNLIWCMRFHVCDTCTQAAKSCFHSKMIKCDWSLLCTFLTLPFSLLHLFNSQKTWYSNQVKGFPPAWYQKRYAWTKFPVGTLYKFQPLEFKCSQKC